MNGLTFDDYQAQAKTTALYLDKFKETYPNLPKEVYEIMGISYAGLGLGETGEVQGKIKKIIRDAGGNITDEVKKAIKKELGDCMWYLAANCSEFGFSLGEVAQENLDKLFSRKERGVLTGSGDNR